MAHFMVEYRELGRPDLRDARRAEHIAYRLGLGARLVLAGPLLDHAGNPTGSVVIVEARDLKDAQAVAEADPFVVAGVLSLVSVRAYRIAAMNPPA